MRFVESENKTKSFKDLGHHARVTDHGQSFVNEYAYPPQVNDEVMIGSLGYQLCKSSHTNMTKAKVGTKTQGFLSRAKKRKNPAVITKDKNNGVDIRRRASRLQDAERNRGEEEEDEEEEEEVFGGRVGNEGPGKPGARIR